jgi:hypothetical protein
MNTYPAVRYSFLAVCIILACGQFHEARGDEWMRETLYPGDTVVHHGITIEWKEDDSESSGTWGLLSFRGPRTTVDKLKPDGAQQSLYLDEVQLVIRPSEKTSPPRMDLSSSPMPSRHVFGGASRLIGQLPLSTYCSVHLNEWELKLSDVPVRLPDGSQLLEITAVNEKSGERVTLPGQKAATRQFGRYELRVNQLYEPTRTVLLTLLAKQDLTIRGRLAYMQSGDLRPNESCESFFTRLAREYGFRVKWVEDEINPEPLQRLRERRSRCGISLSSNQNVQEYLEKILASRCFDSDPSYNMEWDTTVPGRGLDGDPSLDMEWTDDTTLQIRPGQSKQAEEELLRKAQERKQQAQCEKELQELEARFEADYTPVTQVYPLQRMSAETAQTLIETKLMTHYLARISTSGRTRLNMNRLLFDAANAGHCYTIVSLRPNLYLAWITRDAETADRTSEVALRQTREASVADSRANAVIVTAIPQTHREIAALLQQIEGALVTPVQADPPRRYRVQAILLRGEQPKNISASTDTVGKCRVVVEDKLTRPQANTLHHKLLEEGFFPVSVMESANNTYSVLFEALFDETEADRFLKVLIEKGYPKTKVVRLSDQAPDSVPDPSGPASRYGLKSEDLSILAPGLQIIETGRAVLDVLAEPGEAGRAMTTLGDAYQCELEYQQQRAPYIILRGRLKENHLNRSLNRVLLENTVYLEPGKSSLLGVTNLNQALILLLRLEDDNPEEKP